MSDDSNQQGFTLVEVLIALAIVGIALAAGMRALGLSVDGTRALQQRTLALQAAENRLAELRLSGQMPVPGRRLQPCPQGGVDFVCEQVFADTINANFRLVTVRARLGTGPVLGELNGLLSVLP
ncbi:MAG: type II secretion system minor pseudopilin GspI [Pusillimonas sp.]|nr:type II secretion system minor pseudopilin GspI [Pusillimonas sp.]